MIVQYRCVDAVYRRWHEDTHMKWHVQSNASMNLAVEPSDRIARAIRLPATEQQQTLMTELAVALYARGIPSFGDSTSP